MDQNNFQCQMINSLESIKCKKHNEHIDFVLIDENIMGNENLLCCLCFKQIPGLKKVYGISEAVHILQEMKNSEYKEQKTIILHQLQKINNYIEDLLNFQGSLQQLINNALEALKNWKLELEHKIYDISEYNFIQELDRFNNKNQTTKNIQQIFEFIEIKKEQYSKKIQNNLQSLVIKSQEMYNILEFIHNDDEDSELLQMTKLNSYFKQEDDNLILSKKENNEIADESIIQQFSNNECTLSLKLNQTVDKLDKVLTMAFNYNDSLLASSCDKEIKLWKFQNGKICDSIGTLTEHTQKIFTIIFSKKENWLFSAGKDLSIILWKPKKFLFNIIITTKRQYQNAHNDSILQLVLNQNENQLISCSSDCTISIWSVNYKLNTIQYQYSLVKHTGPVISVCLNQSNNLMVSSGLDKQIIIWSENKNQEWMFKQVIDKSTNDFGYRISFIFDIYIVWQSSKMGLTHIFKEENGIFKELPEQRIQLAQNAEIDGDYSFPSIFNSNQQILIQKHHQSIYFLTLNSQNKLTVQQEKIILNDEQIYGNLSNDGKYLAIWCNQVFNIYEINYT